MKTPLSAVIGIGLHLGTSKLPKTKPIPGDHEPCRVLIEKRKQMENHGDDEG